MGLKKGLILIHNGTDAEADEHTPSNIKMYEQIRFNQDYHKLETELKAKLIDYYKPVSYTHLKHAGRRIRLTYMMVEAPAFEVIE